jgi:hypothetical protein
MKHLASENFKIVLRCIWSIKRLKVCVYIRLINVIKVNQGFGELPKGYVLSLQVVKAALNFSVKKVAVFVSKTNCYFDISFECFFGGKKQ